MLKILVLCLLLHLVTCAPQQYTDVFELIKTVSPNAKIEDLEIRSLNNNNNFNPVTTQKSVIEIYDINSNPYSNNPSQIPNFNSNIPNKNYKIDVIETNGDGQNRFQQTQYFYQNNYQNNKPQQVTWNTPELHNQNQFQQPQIFYEVTTTPPQIKQQQTLWNQVSSFQVTNGQEPFVGQNLNAAELQKIFGNQANPNPLVISDASSTKKTFNKNTENEGKKPHKSEEYSSKEDETSREKYDDPPNEYRDRDPADEQYDQNYYRRPPSPDHGPPHHRPPPDHGPPHHRPPPTPPRDRYYRDYDRRPPPPGPHHHRPPPPPPEDRYDHDYDRRPPPPPPDHGPHHHRPPPPHPEDRYDHDYDRRPPPPPPDHGPHHHRPPPPPPEDRYDHDYDRRPPPPPPDHGPHHHRPPPPPPEDRYDHDYDRRPPPRGRGPPRRGPPPPDYDRRSQPPPRDNDAYEPSNNPETSSRDYDDPDEKIKQIFNGVNNNKRSKIGSALSNDGLDYGKYNSNGKNMNPGLFQAVAVTPAE